MTRGADESFAGTTPKNKSNRHPGEESKVRAEGAWTPEHVSKVVPRA
jgi:hypothetical protein